MNGKVLVIALVAAMLAFSVSVATGFWPFGKSATEQWLEKIGLPEGASYVGEPDISDQDGTKPEMLLQEVAMDGEPEGILQEFLKRCLAVGMVDTSANNPSTAQMPLCKSKPGGGDMDFFVDARCENTKCRVFLELHKFGI
jgi:hypothetical protein